LAVPGNAPVLVNATTSPEFLTNLSMPVWCHYSCEGVREISIWGVETELQKKNKMISGAAGKGKAHHAWYSMILPTFHHVL
jgi:hypothetical protein